MSSLTRAQFLRGDWRGRPVTPSPGAFAWLRSGCLALQGVFCRSCSEICAPDAIQFTPRVGAPAVPTIDANACTGCGDCIYVCPTRAIALQERQSEEDS